MKQKEIMALLVEASDPRCSERSLNQIHLALQRAMKWQTPGVRIEYEWGKVEGLQLAMNALYMETISHHRDQLPSLFPVFAMFCGDRKANAYVADINWKLMRSPKAKKSAPKKRAAKRKPASVKKKGN